MDLLAARELELAPAEGLNHLLLVLQLGADGHFDLANVDPLPHFNLGPLRGDYLQMLSYSEELGITAST